MAAIVPKAKPLLDLIEAHGFPATLYISFADWKMIRNFVTPESDDEGAFFWLLTTKVRVKRSDAAVDASATRIFPDPPVKVVADEGAA